MPKQRTDLTVVTASANYGADAVHTCETEEGEPAIAFVCSGRIRVLPADEVEGIHVASAEDPICMTCLS